MAVIVMQSGQRRIVKPEKALRVWKVLIGECEPSTPQEENYCLHVKRVYLNRHTAPKSYLDKYSYLFVSDGPVIVDNKKNYSGRLPYKD